MQGFDEAEAGEDKYMRVSQIAYKSLAKSGRADPSKQLEDTGFHIQF